MRIFILALSLGFAFDACAADATGTDPSGAMSNEQLEDANYSGHCADAEGAYLQHCVSIDGPNCPKCSAIPDSLADYNPSNPQMGSSLQGGTTTGWMIDSQMVSHNNCVRNGTESDALGNKGTCIIKSSADGHHMAETCTITSGVGGPTCTVKFSFEWQQ